MSPSEKPASIPALSVFNASPELRTLLALAFPDINFVFDSTDNAITSGSALVITSGTRIRAGEILDAYEKLKDSAAEKAADTARLGDYIFMPPQTDLAHADGVSVLRLTEKERDILVLLLEAGGQAIKRQELMDRLWGYANGVETHTLETHIYRLRRKIEQDPAAPQILITTEDGYALRYSKI